MLTIDSVLKGFEDISVLVVGDVMLDRYLEGEVERISPEAPVPVVDLHNERLVAGGAANVAANVAGLGAKVTLIGFTGDDPEAAELKALLEVMKIESSGLLVSTSRVTTVKSRIMAGGHQIARLDRERAGDLASEDLEALTARFMQRLKAYDAVIVSDYGKGVVSNEASARLITAAKSAGIPVFVDPKGLDYSKYDGASVLTPNRKEALEVHHSEVRKHGSVEDAGKHILNRFEIEGLVITLGAGGMALFENGREMMTLAASARNVFDVTGAGDTVIAALAVARAAGADLKWAAVIANAAAGEVVEKTGTSAITKSELERALDGVELGDTKAI